MDGLLETFSCKTHKDWAVFIDYNDRTKKWQYSKRFGKKMTEDKVPMHGPDEEYFPDYKGNSNYWYQYKVVELEDYPPSLPCPKCNKQSLSRRQIEINVRAKGNTFNNRQRVRDRIVNGMGKQEAERFYEDSIKNSKERMQSGSEHYKRVDPDMEHFRAEGKARKLTDKETAHKREFLDRANQKLVDNKNKS